MNTPVLPEVAAKIELAFDGYVVQGVAVINTWGDTESAVQMERIFIPGEDVSTEAELIERIKMNINDGGFGCQDIYGAYVVIFARYDSKDGISTKQQVDARFINCDGFNVSEKKQQIAEEIYWGI
jgi:hypothetical protein